MLENMTRPEPINADRVTMEAWRREQYDPRRPGVALEGAGRPETAARTDGGVEPFAGGVVPGTTALRGHVTVTPDGRVDLSKEAAAVGVVGLLALGALAGAAVSTST